MRTHQRITRALVAALATAAGLALTAPAHAEDAIVKLVSGQNGKCLQPLNGSPYAGEPIVQEACNGSHAQQWLVHAVSSTKVHLINRASGLCMDVAGKAVSGVPIDQWPCNWISNENWGFGITNNLLVSAVSNTWSHCLATPGYQDGLPMELRFCNGNSAQRWSRPNG